MSDWPEYVSHKIVRAAKIVSIVIHPGNGDRTIFVRPANAFETEQFKPNLTNMPANVGDWAMLYPDGYKSISPAKAFEDGYSRVTTIE